MAYFSQYGQDEYLDNNVFKNKTGGTFVDIGAYDGKRLSNTYFFEKSRGWKGICFEPNPRIFAALEKNRDCLCINGAVSDKEGQLDFLDLEGLEVLGGLMNNFDRRQLDRIEVDVKNHNVASRQVIKVKSYNINRVLEENNFYDVDYCSIDTEGAEMAIVKSIDFSKFKISVLSVENNFPDSNRLVKFLRDAAGKTVEGYLRKKGYKKIATIQSDDIYQLT